MSVTLKKRIRDAYSLIADDYDRSRKTPFKEVELFLSKGRDKVLDIGTGNGRNIFLACKNAQYVVGVDSCRKMLESARKNLSDHGLLSRAELVLADAGSLPFVDCSFEICACTAVLHHIPIEESWGVVRETMRVLREGGEALFSVWDRREIISKASERTEGGYIVPWGEVGRYFVAYCMNDLRRAAVAYPFSDVFRSYPNNYVKIKKA